MKGGFCCSNCSNFYESACTEIRGFGDIVAINSDSSANLDIYEPDKFGCWLFECYAILLYVDSEGDNRYLAEHPDYPETKMFGHSKTFTTKEAADEAAKSYPHSTVVNRKYKTF